MKLVEQKTINRNDLMCSRPALNIYMPVGSVGGFISHGSPPSGRREWHGVIWGVCDDFIILKCFPHYWPFVREIHKLPMHFPHTWLVMQSYDVFFIIRLNKLWNKNIELPMIWNALTLMWHNCHVPAFTPVLVCVDSGWIWVYYPIMTSETRPQKLSWFSWNLKLKEQWRF